MDIIQRFNDSYENIQTNHYNEFFERFYQNFINRSPMIAQAFAHTDMNRQKDMLEDSMLLIINYYCDRGAVDYMDSLAEKHKHLNIPTKMYDEWLEAMISTVREISQPFNHDDEVAWRTVLGAGINYIKSQSSD